MIKNLSPEDNFEEIWARLVAQPHDDIVWAGHYILVPLFGLISILLNSKKETLGEALLHFLFFLLPYLVLIWIVYKKTKRDLKNNRGMEFDKAVIVSWFSSNGFSFLMGSFLTQLGAVLMLFREFNYALSGKAIAVICFVVTDFLIGILAIYGKRNLTILFPTPENVKGSHGSCLTRSLYEIGVIFLMLLVVVGFFFSGFQDLGDYFEFVLISLASFLFLLICILGYSQLFRVFIWRKRNFWKNELNR
jgi:hypothetical protein